MALTSEQQEERRAYLGGTDASALAGVNPPGWAQPIDVYLEKVGLAPERKQGPMMAMGTLLEPVVSDLFTEATGVRLRRWRRTVRSREYPWAGGHLDRVAEDGGLFEAKWSMRKDDWGDSFVLAALDQPPARVPLRYAVQVQHYLAVTARPFAYLGALLGYGDFRWYVLRRNEETIAWLMELEERFWRENVQAGVPPAPDGSEAYSRHLRRTLASDDGIEQVATPEQAELVERLRLAKEATAAAARIEAEATQLIMDAMGKAAGLVGPGFSISWRQNKPTLKVQWEALATQLMLTSMAEQGIEQPKTKKAAAALIRDTARALSLADEEEGARPFKPTFDTSEEET